MYQLHAPCLHAYLGGSRMIATLWLDSGRRMNAAWWRCLQFSSVGMNAYGCQSHRILSCMHYLCHGLFFPCSDFSNGFLVAEIFERYYGSDIQLHGFDNGNSISVKRDNWSQLLRFFVKRDVRPGGRPVTEADVEDIVHSRGNAVIEFMERIYEFLTNRKLPSTRSASSAPTSMAPPYARDTASRAIR